MKLPTACRVKFFHLQDQLSKIPQILDLLTHLTFISLPSCPSVCMLSKLRYWSVSWTLQDQPRPNSTKPGFILAMSGLQGHFRGFKDSLDKWNGTQIVPPTAPDWFESISGVPDPFRGL